MLDYLSRKNDVSLCDEYDDLRRCKLEKPVYPASIWAVAMASKSETALKAAAETAISDLCASTSWKARSETSSESHFELTKEKIDLYLKKLAKE